MTYTLDDNDLGQVTKERHRQFSDLDMQALPLATAADALILDYNGVKRIITIEGTFSDTEANIMDNLVLVLEALQSGNQISTVVFHSDLYDTGAAQTGNFNVKVDSFTWEWEKGVPGKIGYTLVLFEGI